MFTVDKKLVFDGWNKGLTEKYVPVEEKTASIILFMSTSWSIYLCDLLCHYHFHFHYITIKHIISLIQNNFCFGHVCQKFSLRVLLSFCLIFCQFQPGVAYESIAYKKGAQPENQFSLVKLRSFIKNYLLLISVTVFIKRNSEQKKTVSSSQKIRLKQPV